MCGIAGIPVPDRKSASCTSAVLITGAAVVVITLPSPGGGLDSGHSMRQTHRLVGCAHSTTDDASPYRP